MPISQTLVFENKILGFTLRYTTNVNCVAIIIWVIIEAVFDLDAQGI